MFARHVVLRRHCRIGTFTPSVCRSFSSGFGNNSLFRGQISSYSDSLLQQIIRGYAFKSDLKIKWVRPTKIPSYKPEKTGDLEPLPPVDGKKFPPELLESEEFQTADDLTRRVLTLEFNRRKASMQILRRDMMCRVKRHNLDFGSAETKVAEMTAGIRNLQQVMEEFPRDKKLKVKLNELIDRRKKTLKYIRRWDYKRFEWLLEKLNIVYKPPPSEFHWITRKDSLRKLTDKHCEDIKQARLAAYKASLDAQKISFLQEKIAKLQWIRKEEEECGVKPTVTQEDIDKVIAHLKEIEITQSNETNTIPAQISKQKQTVTTSTR